MRLIRILIRNFRDALRSVLRNFSLSIASITCITITLVLVALSIVISANIDHFTKNLEDTLTVVVYLNEDVTEEDVHPKYESGILSFSVPKAEAKPVEEKKHYISIEG